VHYKITVADIVTGENCIHVQRITVSQTSERPTFNWWWDAKSNQNVFCSYFFLCKIQCRSYWFKL